MNFTQESLFLRLIESTPFSSRELAILIATCAERYKDHFIEKRNGRGKRLISQPTSEVKYLQRLIVSDELSTLPIHEAAVAYRQHLSIKDHADRHATGSYLLKLDFKDFFPTLSESTIRYRLRRDRQYSENELWILCRILCRRNKSTGRLQLSIGAPSSPFLSNYLLWEFDSDITDYCYAKNVKYSRYADDLAFSTTKPHILDSVYDEVRQMLVKHSYLGVSLNHAKTVNVSRKNRRTLVGLTLSNMGTASIGRSQKRMLRDAMFALWQGRLSPNEIATLRGKLAFVHAIDPAFVTQLCLAYRVSRVAEVDSSIVGIDRS